MSSINKILQEVNQNNSRLHKESVLLKYKDDALLKRVLLLTYNKLISFRIKEIPFSLDKELLHQASRDLESALDLLDDLSNNILSGNKAIDEVTTVANSLSYDDTVVFSKIIKRNLDIGVSEKTINKIWPNLIPSYPVMLAMPDKRKNRDTIKFPCYAQIKMDGARINAHVTKDSVEYFTRNGRNIQLNNTKMHQDLMLMRDDLMLMRGVHEVDFVLDGEALCRKPDGSYYDRKTGNGVINRALKKPESLTEEQIESFSIVAWDLIPMDDFKSMYSGTPYDVRFSMLKELLRETSYGYVECVYSRKIDSWESAESFYNEAYDSGEEGLILKNSDLLWENKRPKGCVKMKAELSVELQVVGFKEGQGKYIDKIGALVCESANGISITVGSGLNDEQRLDRDVIGKIVTVKYNELITNKKGERSLFLPIFVEYREDKDFPEVI